MPIQLVIRPAAGRLSECQATLRGGGMNGDRARVLVLVGMGVFVLLVVGIMWVFEPASSPVSDHALQRILRALGQQLKELASVFTS